MKKSKCICVLLATCAAIGWAVAVPQTTEAASTGKNVELDVGKTYTQYDITGDGESDSVKIKVYKDESDADYCEKYRIYLNGKNVYTEKINSYLPTITLYFRDSDAPMFEIQGRAESDLQVYAKLLQYKGGKIKSVLNLHRKQGSGYVKTMQDNKITVTYWKNTSSVGSSERCEYTYTYKDGKWKQSRYGKNVKTTVYTDTGRDNVNTLTANRSFKVYKTIGSKKNGFTIKKGGTVKLLKCRVYKNKVYFQVKYNGEKGWLMEEDNEYDCRESNPLFENLLYAG